jgi:hypothetical protein
MKTYLIIFAILLISVSCEDVTDIDNPDFQLESGLVFGSPETAEDAIEGIYAQLEENVLFADVNRIGNTGLACRTSERPFPDPIFQSFIDFEIDPNNSDVLSVWQNYYSVIYLCNAALEGLELQTYASKDRLRAEALFMRALMHYYLVNLYGDVPLITTTEISENINKPRTPAEEVNQQIIADLQEAQDLLPEGYELYTGLKVRANKWAAKALLARVYLSVEEWENAETLASEVINSNTYSLVALDETFKIGSDEMILQFKPVLGNGVFHRGVVIGPTAPQFGIATNPLTQTFLNRFEPGDQRKVTWTLESFTPFGVVTEPNKITSNSFDAPPPEYEPILRIAEMYMIRSEAKNYLGDFAGSQADLNLLRNRAGLPNTTASTFEELFLAIEEERYSEFFLEEGHRWFDLKRTNRVGETVGNGVPTYEPTDDLWPIPANELANNPNLVQNPGY